MFAETLLESSPARTSILKAGHWLVAMATGLAGFLAGIILIPFAFLPSGSQALVLPSAILAVALTAYTLMLCYTHAEARHLRLRGWAWVPITVLFNLPGFFAFLVRTALKTGDWKRAALAAAYVLEMALVSGLVLVPLFNTEALGKLEVTRWIPLPSPPPGRTQRSPAPSHPAATPQRSQPDTLLVPPVIPPHITIFKDTPSAGEEVDGVGVLGLLGNWPPGSSNGFPVNLLPGNGPPPPLTPAAHRKQQATPTRIGGDVAAARVIYRPAPVYPEIARITHTHGMVKLEAVIGADGTIQNLKVVSGHPLLVRAALEAVARWRYQPTLLNGEPVAVLTDIEVTFSLGN